MARKWYNPASHENEYVAVPANAQNAPQAKLAAGKTLKKFLISLLFWNR